MTTEKDLNGAMTLEEDLDDARMDMATAAWRIANLAGVEVLIADLQSLILIVSTPTETPQ